MRDKRFWIEWGKDVLIVLLTLSAVWLLTRTPLVQDSGVMNLLVPRESPGTGVPSGGRSETVLPARLALRGEEGRCGVQYDQERLQELFPPLGVLLGDALASAGPIRSVSEADWQRGLKGVGVYFDFAGDVPLSALSRWLQGEGEGEGELFGSARRVLLCAGEGDQVLLCWQEADSGAFFSCATALTQSLHLNPAVGGAEANGAYFAFENQALSARLSPYTLITEGEQTGAQYAASNPLAAETAVDTLLEELSFSGPNHAPVSGGEVYLDGGDRLVVGSGGEVTYRAAQGEKYPVGDAGVDGAKALAERTLGALCGEARLYLISAQEGEGGLCIRFGYQLEGSAVYLGQEGWAAEFVVQEGYITSFTLHLRSYAANGGHTPLLPVQMAAAMLPDLTAERRELVIQYRDGGGASVFPEWVAV